ncbi:septum site-determining protein Ssd [Tomitella gaofuii]|uniref:septum site-determining protein Ssd n=1 Tax=Tomitella gaofuii TaxID=2760083 RepID=UPI0015FB418E|nr:septum site-determining protein Ssd [Tomitella gaofuii]
MRKQTAGGVMVAAAATHAVGVWVASTELRVEVERAAAASGVGLSRPGAQDGGRGLSDEQSVAPPTEAEWGRCPIIVLDGDAAAACERAGLPRRRAVLVVAPSGAADARLWQRAVRIGAEDVLELPADEHALLAALNRHAVDGRPGDGGVITVVSGHGGAGASVLASALALTADTPTLLVDLDPDGPGLDLLLGLERDEGLRWPELRVQDGRVDPEALHRALPRREATTVLSSSPPSATADVPWKALRAGAVRSVLRSGHDGGMTVVCDASHQRSEATEAAIETADLTVLVVAADVPACASAVRCSAWVRRHTDDIALVVRGPSPGGLRGGDVEAALGLPLLASMRPEPRIAKALERGGLTLSRRSPLADTARAVHRLHARRPQAGTA